MDLDSGLSIHYNEDRSGAIFSRCVPTFDKEGAKTQYLFDFAKITQSLNLEQDKLFDIINCVNASDA